jgi:thiamine transport system permease protein
VLILGGIRFATLEVQIYYQAYNVFDLPLAAALALVQMGVMFLMMVLYTRLQQRISLDLQSVRRVARKPRNAREKMLLIVNLSLMVILLFTPLIALVIRSVTIGGAGFTLDYFAGLNQNPRDSILFVPPINAIGNSIFFALLTTLLSVSMGLITSYMIAARNRLARWLDALFILPLATSAVTLGFGYLVAPLFASLQLRTSWVIIPIAHTLVAMPFVIRSVLPALRSIPVSMQNAAAVLGASPFQVWRFIDVPLISRGIIVGATFAFTVSMGEFGASLFVARPDTPTIPIVIFRLLSQPGTANYGQAVAMSVILMLTCAVSFVVIERLRTVGTGEF